MIPRVLVYIGKQNLRESIQSLSFDLANVNPIKMVTGVIKGIYDAEIDIDKGIWVGKRCLGDLPIGLTFIPELDFYHWAIMVNGVIYQVVNKDQNGEC
jgi:hypothetical protein